MTNENEKKPVKSEKKSSGEGKRKSTGSAGGYEIEAARPKSPKAAPRLRKQYDEKVVPALIKNLSLKNKMQVPRITKVVVSACVKDALANPKVLDLAADELAMMTGQKPKITRAKKSIAAFKLREGQAIGAVVTLRRARMYEFLDRLISVALPRVRDFKGVNPKSFDGRGNYSMGLKEQIIFPEINYDKIDKIRGLNITIATNAKSNDQARALLTELGMPFRK
jgi:large subunit ribosomal protein L5